MPVHDATPAKYLVPAERPAGTFPMRAVVVPIPQLHQSLDDIPTEQRNCELGCTQYKAMHCHHPFLRFTQETRALGLQPGSTKRVLCIVVDRARGGCCP
ncbi:hypothetical protein V8C40DRAFT_258217, partial [Trichoderma camerunense]